MKSRTFRWKKWLLACLLGAVVLGAGYYVARYQAWPAVKAWRIARMNREAGAFLASGDLPNALLTARKSLQASTKNPEAWRIAAATAEAQEHAVAIWYQDNLYREEPSRKNALDLLRLSLRFENPSYALPTVTAMAKEARDDPAYNRMAAEIYKRMRQPLMAKLYLEALTRLQPDDHAAQLDLAEIELASDPTQQDAATRARVLALADQPDLRVRAISLLLRNNVAGRVKPGTAELVRRLQGEPNLDLAGKLLVIEALFLLEQPEAAQLLAQLQVDVANKPADVARVFEFLNRTGRAQQVRPWADTLPEATRKDEQVQHMVAEALLALHDAPALEAYLRACSWPKGEFLRQALLAHAYRDQGRSAEFEEAWKLALIAIGSDLNKTAVLLARADEWRWLAERHDVVWKIFLLMPTNQNAQQILIRWERKQGNTGNLNRLFSRIIEVEPRNGVALNNFAYTSLLLDSNISRAGLIAADLTRVAPKDPYFATTYAMALYKQGHPADALARLDTLTVSERAEPTRMLLRAMCLAALGRAEAASDLMSGVVLRGMLPEEKRLGEGVMTEIARMDRTQGNRSRLLAYHQNQGQGTGASGWLALVAAQTRSAASTDMQLANSLYSTPDWAGLEELLRTTRWKDADYLRSALMAYVLRQRGDLSGSGDEWQRTVALADRNPVRLQDLRALVTEWQWAPERLDIVNRIFTYNPGDPLLLAELLRSYREAGRTSDLHRVLTLYVGDNPDPTDEAVEQAYYSLLLDTNVAHAHVVARNAFEATPGDAVRRTVYVFSLWKQRRGAEAMPLLAGIQPGAKSELISIPLVRATIQAQMGARAEALASLAEFKPESALPEEVTLASKVSSQLAAQAEAVKPPRT